MAQLPTVRFTSHQLVLKGEVRNTVPFCRTTVCDSRSGAQEARQTLRSSALFAVPPSPHPHRCAHRSLIIT